MKMTYIEKIKLLKKELKNPNEKFINKEICLVMSAYKAYSIMGKRVVDLCELFDGSIADASYGGCYVLPGEILSLEEIYKRLILNEIKRNIVKALIEFNFKDEEINKLAKKYKIEL